MKLSKLLLILLSVMSVNLYASIKTEINHLLSFVGATECKYERNGTMHTGSEAVKHINKKYDYYLDNIESAEDFIKYSATKSTMSGKYYKVYCLNADPIKSKDWLLSELERYRLIEKK